MSRKKNRGRPRSPSWRARPDSLLGAPHRTAHAQYHNEQFGGVPRSPSFASLHRPNPWESGMIPGSRVTGPHLGHHKNWMRPSTSHVHNLLGNPAAAMGGGGSGSSLMAGVSRDATVSSIALLSRMNSREARMSLSMLDNSLNPTGGGAQFGQLQQQGWRARTGGISGRANNRPRGGVGRTRGGGGGSGGATNDLRKWLKDKREFTGSRSTSGQSTSGASTSRSRPRNVGGSAAANRKGRPKFSRGASPAKAIDEKETEAEENCPVEALRCHVCNVNEFSSLNDFKAHLKSTPHEGMWTALSSKNSAVLHLLRQQSKLAALQQTLATSVGDKQPNQRQCFKCLCKVPGSLQKHISSVEHKLVNNFQIVKCCNVWFSNRPEYEQHRLSFRHLLTKYEEKKQAKSSEDQNPLENSEEADDGSVKEWWSPAARALHKLRQGRQSDEPLTLASLAPYAGDCAVGESFMSCYATLECSACDERMEPSAADAHCRSNAHYLHVLDALRAKEVKEVPSQDEAAGNSTSENELTTSATSAMKSNPAKDGVDALDESRKKQRWSIYKRHNVDHSTPGAPSNEDEEFDYDLEDDDERMIYEELYDEPQLEFDDDGDEVHDAASKKNDPEKSTKCGNATAEPNDESATGEEAENTAAAIEETHDEGALPGEYEDEEEADQYEYNLVEDEDERVQREEGSEVPEESAENITYAPEEPAEGECTYAPEETAEGEGTYVPEESAEGEGAYAAEELAEGEGTYAAEELAEGEGTYAHEEAARGEGIDAPEESGEGVDAHESGEGVDAPKESEKGVDAPEESGEGVGAPEESGEGVGAPEESGEGIDAPEESEKGIDAPEESEKGIDAPEKSVEVEGAPEVSDVPGDSEFNNSKPEQQVIDAEDGSGEAREEEGSKPQPEVSDEVETTSVATRRSGRPVRKRPGDNAAEELLTVEPPAKRGRRGRGRGVRF